MTRAFFVAVAITVIILGVECMVVDTMVMSAKEELVTYRITHGQSFFDPLSTSNLAHKTISPPEWAPWTLISAGVVMTLYSLTMKRGNGGGDE